MKRLLIGPALALPLILGLCHLRTPELPKLPEVVREIPLDDFNAFPPIPPAQPAPEKPQWKPHGPTKHHAPARPHARLTKPLKPAVPQARPVDPEPLPPQQGLICIFPLNMIPNCTPQVAGQ
jgi:hypothetical protein